MTRAQLTAPPPDTTDPNPSTRQEDEEELIMNLERDQFVAETSRPVARARLGARATAALWALRVFAVTVSAMVVYTFVVLLH